MNKIAALVIGSVFLMLVSMSMILNAPASPVGVQAAPQATPQPKIGLGGNTQVTPMYFQPSSPAFPDSGPPGSITVVIQLSAPPLAATFQQVYQGALSLSDALIAIRAERVTLESLQQDLIAQLTAPPFSARVIGSTILVSNTIIIEADASLLAQISTLPGVFSVTPDRIIPLDDNPGDEPLSIDPHDDPHLE